MLNHPHAALRRIGRAIVAVAGLATFVPHARAAEPNRPVDVNGLFRTAGTRLAARAAEMATYADTRWPLGRDASSATWLARPAPEWDSGYFPGTLWQLYRHDHDPQTLAAAKRWTMGLIGLGPNDAVPADLSSVTLAPGGHDVGLVYLNAFAEGYAATGDSNYARVVVRAAGQMGSRYDYATGTIRSWDWGPWQRPVIIDGMMTVQALNWASTHGGTGAMWAMAASHAHASAAWHVRADGSTFHVVDFGPATPVGSTYQGYSDTSTWSRGEAWAIHGFTDSSVANPGDATLIDAARRSANYWIAHTLDDAVPLWDFDVPAGAPATTRLRDSSAAAIAAAGLLGLSGRTDRPAEQRAYFQAAERILMRLATPAYLAADAGGETRLLLHGVGNFNSHSATDADLAYADYYFLEGLERYQAMFPGPGIVPGDATRDGRVDFDDLLVLAQHYGRANGEGWLTGDFTADNAVGFDDLLALAQRYGTAASFAADWALAQSLVPEPTSAVVLAALLGSTRRRRA